MRNIYFVQACDLHGSGSNASAYLPYATGLLAAYAFHNETVKENYCVKRFIYRKEQISAAVDSMEAPAVVGFSTYIWNYAYNLALAEEVKRRYPACIVVFGGHSVRNSDCSQLGEFPFIDFLIHGEGEIAFCDILIHFCTDLDFSQIPNISRRDEKGRPVKNPDAPICGIDYPSPYLEGWFDDILANDPVSFSALFETNRGCPFHCAYCDWGSIRQKMRLFSMERVAAEMHYFAEHKIPFCFCIDSNFGMFPRDFEIVDLFLQIKQETGYPEMFKCCTTEGSGMAEFNINKKLNDCGILKGASLALQTLSAEALKNIGRTNMSMERYADLTAKYYMAGIPTYSELIYGLPGETYETFSSNLCYMLQTGTTKGCFIHYCELLPNAALARKENMEKYQIRSAKIPYTQFHTCPDIEIKEYSDIVISTYSMDYEMWIRTCVFGLFVQCFHYMGILQSVSQYLFFEWKIPYKEFYERLILWAEGHPETVLGSYYTEIVQKLGALRRGEEISRVHINPAFGNIDWPLEEGMCLEIITHVDAFFDEIRSFLSSFRIPADMTEELLKYQCHILRKPDDTERSVTYSYDFPDYFYRINVGRPVALRPQTNTLTTYNWQVFDSLEDFATHIVWYGRKSARIVYSGQELRQTL